MSGPDGTGMSRQAFLIMPQRRYKDFLPQLDGQVDARFKTDVNADKKSKYQAPVDLTQEEVKKETPARIGNIFRSEPKLFRVFIEFFLPKEVVAIALTSKKTYRHIMDYESPIAYRISVRAFAHILDSGQSGILHHAQLRVGREGDQATTVEQCLTITKWLENTMPLDTRDEQWMVIELGVMLKEDCTTDMVDNLSAAVGSSRASEEFLSLGFESCSFAPGNFIHLLNCLKGDALQNLQTLNVSHNLVDYTAMHKLKLMLHKDKMYLPSLTALNIASTGAVSAALELFEYKFLRTRPKLTNLDISGNNISLIDADTSKLLARATITWGMLKNVDLSFNPLSDDGLLRILKIVMPLEYDKNNPNKVPTEILIEKFVCQNSEMADGCIDHLVSHMKLDRFPHLHTLHLQMNLITKHGITWLIDPLIDRKLPALRDLGLSMNNLGDDGMIRMANSIILGALDILEILDIAEVGAGINNINYFGKCLIDRDELKIPSILQLRILRLYGGQPFIGKKKAKLDFPPTFLGRIKVT